MATAVYADPEPQSLQASVEAPPPKNMEINFTVNTSKSYRFDALPNRLKAVTKNKGDTIPY